MERQRLQGPMNSSFTSMMTEHPNYTFPSMEDDEQSKLNPFPLPLMQEQSFQLPLRLQHQKLMTMMMMMMPPLEHQYLSSVTSNNEMVIEYESYKTQNQISQIDQITSGAAGRKPRKRTDVSSKERKKRKRPTMKNKEQVESQRMTHIAVERNRRRLMNEHLNVLRSLMPPPYSQKGDQASVVGGAIDFVKELEQLLQSLEAQKRIRHSENNIAFSTSSSTSSSSNMLSSSLMESSPSSSSTTASSFHFRYSGDEELSAETKTGLAEIEVLVIQNHVNLKIQGQRRPGQLLKTIVALENLRLSVLHLSITSLHSFLHYSFNLKMEDECKLGSAEEVAVAVYQIFSFINSG